MAKCLILSLEDLDNKAVAFCLDCSKSWVLTFSLHLKRRITGSCIKQDKVWVTDPNIGFFFSCFTSGGNEVEVRYKHEIRLVTMRKEDELIFTKYAFYSFFNL